CRVHPVRRLVKTLPPVREIDARGIDSKARAIGHSDDRHVEAAGQQVVTLPMQLAEDRPADVAGPDEHELERRARLKKCLMDGVERPPLLPRVDDARYVALRGSLG